MGPLARVVLLGASLSSAGVLACEVADGDQAPWQRAMAKVKYSPDAEAMASLQPDRSVMRYVLSLDKPRHLDGRCWWPVEVRVNGRLWKRYLVTPQGDALREDPARAGR